MNGIKLQNDKDSGEANPSLICDLVIEDKPFRELEGDSSLLSSELALSSELVEGIMSHFGFSEVQYFKYRSLERNIQEYDNMINTMFSLADILLNEEDPQKFRSILSNFSNIYSKLPKLKERLKGFGVILTGEDIKARLTEIEQKNSVDFQYLSVSVLPNYEDLASEIEQRLNERRRDLTPGVRGRLKVKTLKRKNKRSSKRKSKRSSKRKSKRKKTKKRKTKKKSKR